MQRKALLVLIFLVIILSSCSIETEEKLIDKKDYSNPEEKEVNNNDIENAVGGKINNKEDSEITVEQIINDIKIESGITEDIELSDIKKIQDTYYVVVKVNKAEIIDQYYMLWKYNKTKEMLLKGKVIEILTLNNYYFVNYRENFSDNSNYRITKYNHNDESYKKIIYEGKSLEFSFSPNNEYILIQDDNEIIILDENYEILFNNKVYNNAENVYDHHPVEVKFISWSKDNKQLWVATGYNAYVMTFHRIDIENSTLNTYYSGEGYGITEIALNPDNGCIAYSTKPEFYESGAYDEFMQNQTKVYLYFLNLQTNEKIEISSSVTRGFRPEWINNKEFEYNDPNGFTRLTFNIDDYYSNMDKENNSENEEDLWQDAEGITPTVNNKDGNWYYNETTYKIKLKIPSIYHIDSPGVYFYWREDNKGCHMSLTNFIYELDKNITFIENVKKIYSLNNSDINENLFDNEIIEEGITDNVYKYAYFIDDISDSSDGRVLSYIFVQLDDNVICRLNYSLFSEDFGKFDAKVIINSITHTLTTGLLRDEFLIIHNENSSDVANRVNFKVPYFYIENYRGKYYYEEPEKEGFSYYLDYWIDDKEKFTVYLNDGNTAIEYMGNTTEGYTKNGYKYSYYVEERNESYHHYGTEISEEVLKLTTNISVKLDENSVLKMKYELSEKDFNSFNINSILDSIILK